MFIKTENWILQNTLAYFPIVLNIDNNGNYTLDSSDIEYHAANMSINHEFFWQNTQWLIYHTVNYKASLMSLLFGSLKTKRSLHFLTKTRSDIDNIDVSVEINAFDDICVNLEFPCDCVYDDTNMAYHSMLDKIDNLSQLVSNGYKFAENNKTPDNNLIDKINNISTCVAKKLYEKISNENLESLLTLCKVAVAYVYPTYNFNNKAFSTILSKYIDVKSNLEISNGGLFLLWDGVNNAERIIDIIAHDPTFFQVRVDAIQYCFNITTSAMLNRVLRESLKSAVSAIMTRNMSHNLGSHYLHYTKTQLENLAKKGGEYGPDIRGAARVMGYMQGRMDYLATLISGDRYPYGCVNFKSQIFDELTIDDFSKRHFETSGISYDGLYPILDLLEDAQNEINNDQLKEDDLGKLLYEIHNLVNDALKNKSHNRTTNFLLSNLILSENFTRPDILDDNSSSNNNLRIIALQVLLDLKDKNEEIFTGVFTGLPNKKDNEENIKRKLSEVNIAIPGGVMSSHAFFNIVENFIRNSAKYLQTDFSKSGNLTITIKITEINGYYEFTLFDDKQNANKKQPDTNKSLLDDLLDKISNLRILDDNNALDKKDKGFKEMLFSALWLRSYMYQNITNNDLPQSYEEVLVKIQSADIAERFKLIKLYGFELLAVDDDGNVSQEDNANLALRFSLPKFSPKTLMALSDNDLHINLSNLLHIYADVAIVDTKQYTDFVDKLNDKRIAEDKDTYEEDMIVPRLLKSENKLSSIAALQKVLYARFGKEFDDYEIVSGSPENDKLSTPLADNKKIYFQRHLSTQDVIERYKGYAYADSVSGGNYTITLFDIYERWAKDGRNKDSEDYHHILKIKESALTRITIVDERFFKKMKEQHMETELACKNIRVLNYNDSMSKETEIAKFLEGNEFNDHANCTHFLSIHLGIIEKIIKNVDMFKKIENNAEKVRLLMKMLKKHFGPKVFISIHSGRGNFSAELEDSLDMYPFISMAALENAYENSKYLLAQLFYSTVYIGKGVANHEN